MLARGGAADRAAIEAHFAPSLLAKASAEKLGAALVTLAGHTAAMKIRRVASDDDTRVVLHATAAEGAFLLILGVAPGDPRISHLDVQPDVGPKPRTFDAAVAQLRAQSSTAQLLIAELKDGACVPLHAWNATAQLAIASQFKLYVLLALADHVAAGKARWDDELTLRADWRSLPGGVTQDEPIGARRSLRTLAERMIEISDNTASDYLLYTVGRERVEAAVRASGHSHPERNAPFLGTRELFWIKLMMSRAEIDRYVAQHAAQRRRFLDGLAGKHPVNDGDFWSEPREIDRVEWFASGEDLCRVMAALHARAQLPAGAPVLEILGKNPALEAKHGHRWRYAGFKGGSEPGVIGASWLLQRDDGRWFVVHLGAHSTKPLDEGAAIAIGHGLIDLAAAER